MVEIGLELIVFKNYRKKSGKRMVMTQLLIWLNESITTLNTTLQYLDIYRYRL